MLLQAGRPDSRTCEKHDCPRHQTEALASELEAKVYPRKMCILVEVKNRIEWSVAAS